LRQTKDAKRPNATKPRFRRYPFRQYIFANILMDRILFRLLPNRIPLRPKTRYQSEAGESATLGAKFAPQRARL
jgi:hypothetical protein